MKLALEVPAHLESITGRTIRDACNYSRLKECCADRAAPPLPSLLFALRIPRPCSFSGSGWSTFTHRAIRSFCQPFAPKSKQSLLRFCALEHRGFNTSVLPRWADSGRRDPAWSRMTDDMNSSKPREHDRGMLPWTSASAASAETICSVSRLPCRLGMDSPSPRCMLRPHPGSRSSLSMTALRLVSILLTTTTLSFLHILLCHGS